MSLKEEIERELAVPIRIRAGAPGSLNVLVNGEKIFSRQQAGRAPNGAEIIRLIRGRVPQV